MEMDVSPDRTEKLLKVFGRRMFSHPSTRNQNNIDSAFYYYNIIKKLG
jgi:hypothetical protein